MKQQISLFNAPTRVLKDEDLVETLKDMVSNYDSDVPFYVMNVGDIVQKVKTWRHKLPRVKLFYATKCNDHPYVLQTLNALGAGFDCASKSEIKLIRGMGVDPSRIIYAHPVKPSSHLKAAKSFGVDLMTFDSQNELEKIKIEFPEARLILRIRCDASDALCLFGMKFGLLPEFAPGILQTAKDLGLNVVGVSFHVGSGCLESEVFLRAIKQAKDVFEVAKEIGFNFHILDIGGGFLGNSENSLDEVSLYVNMALEEHFPNENEVEIIAEPGRYVVASAFTLVTKVVSKKEVLVAENKPAYSYYINDGVYGSFNCIFYDHQELQPSILRDVTPDEACHISTIWGPSCDSLDVITQEILMPELHSGDWIFWRDMGAYTLVGATPFNGFPVPIVHMIVPYHTWIYLDEALRELDNPGTEGKELDTDDGLNYVDLKCNWTNGFIKDKSYGSIVDNINQTVPNCITCGQMMPGLVSFAQKEK